MQNSDTYANDINQNQNNGQNNSNKDSELIQINEDRNIEFFNNINNNFNNNKIDLEKINLINEKFTNLIKQIRMDPENEIKLKNLLEKIKYILQERCKNINAKLIGNIYQFTVCDLYKNRWIENFCELIPKYLKNGEIMELIIYILFLSSEFIKYFSGNDYLLIDNKALFEKNQYFISSDKYIDLYNEILDLYIKEKNKKINNLMVFFISNIAEEEKNNQEKLFFSGTLNYIINSIDIENDSSKEIVAKIWCIGKFDLGQKYNINLDLTLKIQNIYVKLFDKYKKSNLFDEINDKMDKSSLFYNFLKLIDNTSYCTQVAYFETLLSSNILEFLMKKDNNKNKIMINIILNAYTKLTTAETSLKKRLIDIDVLKFLINLVKDKTLDSDIHNKALISINNLLINPHLWNKVLFYNDSDVLELFCNLLNDKNIDKNNFSEICYGLKGILIFLEKGCLSEIIEKKNIIKLTTNAMKNILKANKKIDYSHCLIYLTFIIKFMSLAHNIREKILIIIKKEKGLELIEQIINRYSDIDIKNVTNDAKRDIKKLLTYTQVIKELIKE